VVEWERTEQWEGNDERAHLMCKTNILQAADGERANDERKRAARKTRE